MATENYKSAIIGLDAQFENQQGIQTDIDRVERALYLGKILGKEQGKSLAFNCMSAVERMALANQVSVADIKVIVLAQSTTEHVIAIESAIENAIVVSSLAKALQQIDVLIAQNALVALVGVSDKQNETDASQKLATISFDQAFAGYQPCQGVAALLFAPVNFVQANSNYVYSWLKGFSAGNDVEAVIACALDNAQVNATAIDLLEVSALADEKNSLLEAQGLLASYANNALNNALNTAISCARSVTGEGEGFSQVLGLLRTVVALQQRYIPAITDWQQPLADKLANWQNSSFYLPTESRPWYPNQDGSAHIAAYSCLAANDDYCHVVLAENKIKLAGEKHPSTDIRDNGFIACSDAHLVLITGDSKQHLLTKLAEIEDKLIASNECNSDIVKKIASNCFEQFNNPVASYTISLLCESKEELAKEIQSAKSGIPVAFSKQEEWRTPKGSFFTPVPVNKASTTGEDNISFLYPGIGATYVGLGRDLFHLFPEIHQDVANLADDIGASLKDKLLNPRSIIRPDFKALKQLDLNLRGKLADIAEAGVGFACVFTKVFENVFKVKADFATGYSMGEVSMYAALGAWQQPGLMSARLANSETFNQRLCGDLLTLREHWGLPEPSQTNNELIWETYTIKATLDDVIVASEGEERVYCTIVNTPDSLLLGGYPADCLRVIKKLGVRAMPLNMANAIHSAPAKIEYDDMVDLYTMDVTERLKTKMYSSSCYLPVPQMSKAIAHSVAKCLCDRVDFPRLINTMHDKGARVFIEMGPGRSLCSWVDKMLDDEKSHVAVPVNAKGTSDELTYFRAVSYTHLTLPTNREV